MLCLTWAELETDKCSTHVQCCYSYSSTSQIQKTKTPPPPVNCQRLAQSKVLLWIHNLIKIKLYKWKHWQTLSYSSTTGNSYKQHFHSSSIPYPWKFTLITCSFVNVLSCPSSLSARHTIQLLQQIYSTASVHTWHQFPLMFTV